VLLSPDTLAFPGKIAPAPVVGLAEVLALQPDAVSRLRRSERRGRVI
jgi:hypothetical protein